jgi:hypothetical protein
LPLGGALREPLAQLLVSVLRHDVVDELPKDKDQRERRGCPVGCQSGEDKIADGEFSDEFTFRLWRDGSSAIAPVAAFVARCEDRGAQTFGLTFCEDGERRFGPASARRFHEHVGHAKQSV